MIDTFFVCLFGFDLQTKISIERSAVGGAIIIFVSNCWGIVLGQKSQYCHNAVEMLWEEMLY